MKKIRNSGLIWAVGISAFVFLLMILPYLLNNAPFEYGGDLKPTYFPYYSEFRSLIGEFVKGNGMPFYSWDLFLGNNFWASKSFYILGDLFYYISLLFNTHFYNIFAIQTFLKIIVATASFYYLAKTFNYSKKTSIALSVCYGLSSWLMFFLGQPMFISAYAFIPLFFVGLEKYLRDKKITVFLISTALILLTNYYMFFALSVLAPVYFLVRYYCINESFKGWFMSALRLIGIYLVGVSVTAVLILPSFLYIMQNDRVGTFYLSFSFDQLQIYFHQLQAMFIPSQSIIYHGYNIFETGSHVTRELCLWAGSISALLVPQLLTDKDSKYRNAMLLLYAVLIILIITPSGNMMMLGFSSPSFRWTYLFIIINLIVGGKYLSNMNLIHKKNLVISTIVIVSVCVLNMPLYLLLTQQLGLFADNIGLYYLSLTSAAFFIALSLVLLSKVKHKMIIVLVITVFELSLYNVKLIGFDRRNVDSSWDFVNRATTVLQSTPDELNRYLDGLEDINYASYYRVFVPHDSLYWSYSHNHNLHYQLQGVMTYDSTYAPSFNDMKKIAPSVKAFNSEWIFNIQDPNLIDFLSVKYAVVVDPKELPHEDFTLITDSYRGSLYVYENNRYRDVGVTYNKVISYDEFEKRGNPLPELMTTVVTDTYNVEIIESMLRDEIVSLKNIDYHNNYFYGNTTSENGGFMVLSIPYDEGWNVMVNGQTVQTYSVNGGMLAFKIEAGFAEVTMNFMPSGFKLGLIITCLGLFGTIVLIYFDNKRKKV